MVITRIGHRPRLPMPAIVKVYSRKQITIAKGINMTDDE